MLYALAAFAVALQLAAAYGPGAGLHRDELYALACADHPALGYVDFPPLSIWLLWAVRAVVGDSLLAIRLVPAWAFGATVLVAGWIARDLGGGRRAQLLSSIGVIFAPGLLALFHVYSPRALHVLLATLVFWLMSHLLRRPTAPRVLAVGGVFGLALLGDYGALPLAFGLLLGLVATPERSLLRTGGAWLACALAAALFLPHVLWQLSQDWPTLELVASSSARALRPRAPAELLALQALLANPFAAPLWLAGAWWLVVATASLRVRAVGVAVMVVGFVTLFDPTARALDLAPAWPLLFAAGGVALEGAAEARRWIVPAAAAIAVGGGLVAVPYALPILSPQAFLDFEARIGLSLPRPARAESGRLPPFFEDMQGWEEVAAAVARGWETLSETERARAIVLAPRYGQAAALDRFGREAGLPPATSWHNSYWLWGPGDPEMQIAVALSEGRGALARRFEEVERVGEVECRWCAPEEGRMKVFVARRPKRELAAEWGELKRFVWPRRSF